MSSYWKVTINNYDVVMVQAPSLTSAFCVALHGSPSGTGCNSVTSVHVEESCYEEWSNTRWGCGDCAETDS